MWTMPCMTCGIKRTYDKYAIKRGRPSLFCQPCSVPEYFKDKPKRTVEDKAQYSKQYYQDNKDALAEYYSDYRLRLKEEMVEVFGGCCSECGEDDVIVLVLDHINNNAQLDREENNHNGGFKLYSRLKRLGWPKEGYQLLCHNCNYRKEFWRRRDAVFDKEAS